MALSVSQIISKTISTTRDRFGSLLGLWAAWFGVQILLFIVFGAAVGSVFASAAMGASPAAMGGGTITAIIVFYIAYLLVVAAQMASLSAASSPLQRPGFGDAFNAGIKSAPTLLGVMVLLMIAYFVLALGFGLLAALLSMAGKAGSAVAIIIILVAVFYAACRLAPIYPVVSVDKEGNPLAAIRRAWSMTRGNALPIFLAFLVFSLGVVVMIAILVLPVVGSFQAAMMGGAPPFGTLAFVGIGGLVLFVLLQIVQSVMMAVIHGELAGGSSEQLGEAFS